MRRLGVALQYAGLILPPLSLIWGWGPITLFASLGFAVCLFSIGRMIEGYSR